MSLENLNCKEISTIVEGLITENKDNWLLECLLI
jgi:hypothetical protein